MSRDPSHRISCVAVLIVAACGSSSPGRLAADGSGGRASGGQAGHSTTSAGGKKAAGGSGGTEPGENADAAVVCSSEPVHHGQATYYTTADGTGNCSFDASPNDLDIGAMNAADYAGSAACGACVHLMGPNGALTIRVVDQCPECPQGNIDLSPEAFDQIAEMSAGRVAITWQYVACTESGPLSYRFKEGSSQYWTAVQVRDHRYRIAKFEVQKNGAFVSVPRMDYDYFVDASGMGPGPYTFRVTDVYGATVTDTNIPLEVAKVVAGQGQFPVCE